MEKVIKKTSTVSIGNEHIEQVLKDTLCIPINADMTITVIRTGSVDRGNYEEVLDSITFKWETEL